MYDTSEGLQLVAADRAAAVRIKDENEVRELIVAAQGGDLARRMLIVTHARDIERAVATGPDGRYLAKVHAAIIALVRTANGFRPVKACLP